jgi:polyhydroxybutyrate depolymerase
MAMKKSLPLLAALLSWAGALFPAAVSAALLPFEGVEVTREAFTPADGIARTITYFKPPNVAANAPAVFVLHYNLASAQPMANLTEVGQLARDYGVWVIMPTAAIPTGKNGPSWNVEANRDTGSDDVAFLDQLIDHAITAKSLDPKRIYMTGYSDGGNMTVRFSCEKPGKLAAAGAVSATMRQSQSSLGRCEPSTGTPFIYILGTEDNQVLYSPNVLTDPIPYLGCTAAFRCNLSAKAAAKKWADLNHCTVGPTNVKLPDTVSDGTTVEVDTYSSCANNALVELYSVINGGHTWPGSLDFAPRAGITSQDINATQTMWNFFKQFSR